jgi:hypothetical protein
VLVSANIFGWHWRSVFAVNIPTAAAVLTAAVIVPETRQARAQRPDYRGLGLLAPGWWRSSTRRWRGQALGWPAWTFILIAAGVVLVAALAIAGPRLTPRSAAPILSGLLTRPAFTAGITVQLLFSLGLQCLGVVAALVAAGRVRLLVTIFVATLNGSALLRVCTGGTLSRQDRQVGSGHSLRVEETPFPRAGTATTSRRLHARIHQGIAGVRSADSDGVGHRRTRCRQCGRIYQRGRIYD